MPTPSSDAIIEASYISGVTGDGHVAATDFNDFWAIANGQSVSAGTSDVYKWGTAALGSAGGTVYYYFDPASNWTTTEQQAFAGIYGLWAAVANVSFAATSDSSQADIVITRNSNGLANGGPSDLTGVSGSGAIGGTNAWQITAATLTVDPSVYGPLNGDIDSYGGYTLEAMLHEAGHTLGLGHGGPYPSSPTDVTVHEATEQYGPYDSRLWTIMSYIDPDAATAEYYNQYPVMGTNWGTSNVDGRYSYNEPSTWMPVDILAIQQLYGVAVDTPLSGGQVFGFNTNITGPIAAYFDFTKDIYPVVTLWDRGMGNTLNISGFSQAAGVNLNAGSFSSVDGQTNNIGIAYYTVIDTLVCGAGSDTVLCNNDGDIITGGLGNDTINGGGGNDTAVYSGKRNAYTVTHNANGSITIAGADGTDTLTNVEKAQFSDGTISLAIARNDFNADGKSDILWQNADGTGAVWLLNGTTLSGGNTIGNPGSVTWKAIGSGDFDGDGKADILWQNTDGSAAVWLMNGSTLAGGGVPGNPGPAWTALGAADFNGDGKSDILWRDGSGNIAIWLMNGATLTGGAVAGNPGNGWSYKGYGDFNGDGKTDLVFQNTDGSIAIWLMNGAIVTGGGPVGNPGSNWSVRAVGDFDGDGKSDLLLQDTSGAAVVWEMNGTTVSGGGPVGNPGTAWTVKMAEDVDGDGKADILWQAGDGSPAVWLMNGTNVTGGGIVGSNPGSNWHIVTG